MRGKRLLLTALVIAAGVWYCARSPEKDDGRVELVVHAKLLPDAGHAWAKALSGIDLVDDAALFPRAPIALALDRLDAAARSGRPAPDLGTWRRLRLRGRPADLRRALGRLAARPDVADAFVAPVPELPVLAPLPDGDRDRCPLKTPPYDELQGYLGRAPGGIDAPAAWAQPGGRGQAVWFADIEGGWNGAHEDLPGDRIHAIGRPVPGRGWEMHGTAVLGEVAARDNGLGMVGIAPEMARLVTSSIADVSPAAAIDRAQAELRAGDVLLIELHAIGPRGRFLPMEYWDDVFEAIQIATARGIVVIEAAGNGGEDLDHKAYRGRLDRRVRDSGAIMVGAGAPNLPGWVDRSRLDFSNYGSRVDVQGWGRMVASLDYGDLQDCDADPRKYTSRFAGTSSASPIVAGAAALVQSVAKTRHDGCPLPPAAVRNLLVDTGSLQTDGPHGPARQHIGPRPDLARALAEMPPHRVGPCH